MGSPVDLDSIGAEVRWDVDRLWPDETEQGRFLCLVEEVGEACRAATKRRHAMVAASGKCKGLTAAEWTENLRVELAQALGVILDIYDREGFSMNEAIVEVGHVLRGRES